MWILKWPNEEDYKVKSSRTVTLFGVLPYLWDCLWQLHHTAHRPHGKHRTDRVPVLWCRWPTWCCGILGAVVWTVAAVTLRCWSGFIWNEPSVNVFSSASPASPRFQSQKPFWCQATNANWVLGSFFTVKPSLLSCFQHTLSYKSEFSFCEFNLNYKTRRMTHIQIQQSLKTLNYYILFKTLNKINYYNLTV